MNVFGLVLFMFAYWPTRIWQALKNSFRREPSWGDIGWLIGFALLVISFPLNIPDLFSFCFAAALVAGWLAYRSGSGGEGVVRGTQIQIAKPIKKSNFKNEELNVGGVPIQIQNEAQHFLVAGSTGTGKSQVINSFLKDLRARGDRVLVVDSGGEAMSKLWHENDTLLNPLDARTANWSPFAEMQNQYDADRLSQSMIPTSEAGSEREWQLFSQTLIAAVMQRLHERGEGTNERLVQVLTVDKTDVIEPLIAGLSAQTLFDAGAAKMLSSVRGIIGSYLPSYRFLNSQAGHEGFSIRKWVQNDDAGWLWISYRDDQLPSLKSLISCWIGEASNAALSLQPSQSRRLWIVCDELASLGRIAGLAQALTKGRKYGLRVVAGLQSVSQLRASYGREESQTLLSCLSNLVCLRAADGETAKYFSEGFGKTEILREETSEGSSSNGSSSNKSIRHVTQDAVMASEISGLQNLNGYVRLASDPANVFLVQVPIADLGEERIKPFVSR